MITLYNNVRRSRSQSLFCTMMTVNRGLIKVVGLDTVAFWLLCIWVTCPRYVDALCVFANAHDCFCSNYLAPFSIYLMVAADSEPCVIATVFFYEETAGPQISDESNPCRNPDTGRCSGVWCKKGAQQAVLYNISLNGLAVISLCHW